MFRDRGTLARSLALSNEAVAMARRLADRVALGYALNARMHALWGIEPAPERLATGRSSGRSPTTSATSCWRCTGTCGASESCWPRATSTPSTRRSPGSEPGTPDRCTRSRPRSSSTSAAMMALLAGDFETAEQLGQRALEVAEGHNELALELLRGAHDVDLVAARRPSAARTRRSGRSSPQAPAEYPTVSAALALVHAEAGDTDAALARTAALLGNRDGRTWRTTRPRVWRSPWRRRPAA